MLLKPVDEEKEEMLSAGFLINDEEKLKVGKRKAKIISKGLPVRLYRDLHELGEPGSQGLVGCGRKTLPSRVNDGKHRINPLPTYKSILLLSGEHGRGKSSLIANWVNYSRKKHPNVLLIPHFVGSTCESSDILLVIYYFITELQYKSYGTQLETDILHEDANILVFSFLVEVFIASISVKPCILVLDGIEELVGIYGISGEKAKDLSWLPGSLSPHCRFIMSTVSSSLSYKSLCARPDVRTVELISTEDDEAKLLLANELKECRIYRNEFQCLKEYLGVVPIQELWELILKHWTEDYSWTLKQKKANSDTAASGEGRWKQGLCAQGRILQVEPSTAVPLAIPTPPGLCRKARSSSPGTAPFPDFAFPFAKRCIEVSTVPLSKTHPFIYSFDTGSFIRTGPSLDINFYG
eukprot:bmy_04802T0